MDSIEKYIEDLKSDSGNKRFDACRSLRRMKTIPQSAIDALLETINDSDFLVAREAKKALQAHNVPINESKGDGESKDSNSASQKFLKVYGWIILIGLVFSLVIFGPEGFIFLLAFLGGPILFLIVVIGVIGYFISSSRGKSSVKDTDKNGEKSEETQPQRNEPLNLWPVIIIIVAGMLFAIISSLLN